jgi:regulatory protein
MSHRREPNGTDAKDLALHRLSVREYGSGEMRSYLIRKGVTPEQAARVVDELLAEKLIDDERYARVIARHQAFRDKGPAYVRARLRQKGVNISPARIQSIYNETMPENLGSELDLARSVVERRYPRAFADPTERRKAYQALLRRGFSPDVVQRCLKLTSDT